MTNSESTDDYQTIAGHIFAVFNNAHSRVNRMKLLPSQQYRSSKQNFESWGTGSHAGSFILVNKKYGDYDNRIN